MTQPKLKGIRPSNSSSRPDLTIYRSTRKLLSPDLVTTMIQTNLRCHTVIYKSRPDLSQIDTKQLRQDQVLIDTRTASVFTVSKSHHHRAYSLSPSPTSKCLALAVLKIRWTIAVFLSCRKLSKICNLHRWNWHRLRSFNGSLNFWASWHWKTRPHKSWWTTALSRSPRFRIKRHPLPQDNQLCAWRLEK